MKTRAAIAWKAGAPLTIEEVDLAGPRAGEVLLEIKATGIWGQVSGPVSMLDDHPSGLLAIPALLYSVSTLLMRLSGGRVACLHWAR